MTATIYHNPKCSTSRKVKTYLEESGYNVEVVPYLTAGLSSSDFKKLISKVENNDVIMRTKEEEYKQLKPKPNTIQEMAEALADHPRIMERPVVVIGEDAIVARPFDYFEHWVTSKLQKSS